MILIPVATGNMLEVPVDFTGIGIKCQGGIRIENIAASCATLNFSPGDRHRYANKN